MDEAGTYGVESLDVFRRIVIIDFDRMAHVLVTEFGTHLAAYVHQAKVFGSAIASFGVIVDFDTSF